MKKSPRIKYLKEVWASAGAWKADVVLLVGKRDLLRKWCKTQLIKSRYERVRSAVEEDVDDTVRGQLFPVGGGGSIIWLPRYDVACLVHEIAHAVFTVLNTKNLSHSTETDEAYAYLTEHLFAELTGR